MTAKPKCQDLRALNAEIHSPVLDAQYRRLPNTAKLGKLGLTKTLTLRDYLDGFTRRDVDSLSGRTEVSHQLFP